MRWPPIFWLAMALSAIFCNAQEPEFQDPSYQHRDFWFEPAPDYGRQSSQKTLSDVDYVLKTCTETPNVGAGIDACSWVISRKETSQKQRAVAHKRRGYLHIEWSQWDLAVEDLLQAIMLEPVSKCVEWLRLA
jgi:hypothetical protein